MKKNLKNYRQSAKNLLITLVLLVAFIGPLVGLVKNLYKLGDARQEISQIKSEIDRLNNKNEEISQLVDYFDSREFLEGEARLRFDLKKPDDQIIVFKLANDQEPIEINERIFDLPTPPKTKVPITYNPKRWFAYFFPND